MSSEEKIRPVADEEYYSNKEYEATLKNIEFEGKKLVKDGVSEDWVSEVFSWLNNNNPDSLENTDDSGGYPSKEDISEALKDLGWLDEDV